MKTTIILLMFFISLGLVCPNDAKSQFNGGCNTKTIKNIQEIELPAKLNLYFKKRCNCLKHSSRFAYCNLNKYAELAKSDGEVNISVIGYMNVGEANLAGKKRKVCGSSSCKEITIEAASKKRAEKITKYLIDKGVDISQISCIYEMVPLKYSNDKYNRKVEVIISK